MKIILNYEIEKFSNAPLQLVGAFEKVSDGNKKAVITSSNKEIVKSLAELKETSFTGGKGQTQYLTIDGASVLVVGLGEKKSAKSEVLRKAIAKAYKSIKSKKTVAIDVASFNCVGNLVKAANLIQESVELSNYEFNKYKAASKDSKINVTLFLNDKKIKRTLEKQFEFTKNITDSVNIARAFVDEAPNVLHSVEYAKRIEKDVKANLKGVKVNILGKAEIKKEKMGCFLSVNAGSAHDPRLVQLTYTPKKGNKNTKHIALVGKGLTFDTGGYSLKPSASIQTMKYDMGGSATVYGAFRAAVLNNSPYKITCVLGMTDNAVNEHATFPDAIVQARNGKYVEILNTDAEGRLVLADCLDYVSDLKPNVIIDAATLTGACLVALGSEVAALLGNSDKVMKKIQSCAKSQDEYIWPMPIIDEWRDSMKSENADLRNISKGRFAGTATAAAFLENFIQEGIEWAHLDIAGVASDQAHLAYCPSKGGSGIMVRSLHEYLQNA